MSVPVALSDDNDVDDGRFDDRLEEAKCGLEEADERMVEVNEPTDDVTEAGTPNADDGTGIPEDIRGKDDDDTEVVGLEQMLQLFDRENVGNQDKKPDVTEDGAAFVESDPDFVEFGGSKPDCTVSSGSNWTESRGSKLDCCTMFGSDELQSTVS